MHCGPFSYSNALTIEGNSPGLRETLDRTHLQIEDSVSMHGAGYLHGRLLVEAVGHNLVHQTERRSASKGEHLGSKSTSWPK